MTPKHLPGIVLGSDDAWEKEPDEFTVAVEKGMKGLSYGFDNGLIRTNNYLYGTHRGRYYLLGAESGVGKTTLGDYMFVIKMWLDCKAKGVPFKCLYLSFELSKREKIARWTSTFVKLLFNVDIPSDYIMGRIPGLTLSRDHFQMVRMAKRYVNEMLKDVEVLEGGIHPTWVFNHIIKEYYEKLGKVHRDKPKHSKDPGFIRGFTPHDPQLVTMLLCDHVALAHNEKGLTNTKAIIDKLSNYAVTLKNTFDTIIVFLQQFSTELTSAHRMNKKGESVFAPQRLDFGDSKYTYRDADVVMGLISPIQFELETYKRYDIEQLMHYFLAMHLMKNRYGSASRMIPLFINPIAGVFEELPPEPTNELAMQPYYDKVHSLEQESEKFRPKIAAAA